MMIELAGVTFNDTGLGWVFADLVDWYTLPDSKAENIPAPQSHGSFDPGQDWRAAAAISFTAGYIGSSQAECIAAVEEFTALGSLETGPVMRVTDDLRTTERQVSVRNIDVPDFFGYDQFEVHFAVDVLAWDPIRYGTAVDYSTGLATPGGGLEYPLHSGGSGGALYYGSNGDLGRVSITNSGTAPVWPSVNVVGGFTNGFYIQRLDTGQVVRYDRVVPAGSSVSINFRTGEVLIDGLSDGSTYLTRDEFFSVGAGESIDVQLNAINGSSGSPLATFTVASGGWW